MENEGCGVRNVEKGESGKCASVKNEKYEECGVCIF